MNKRLVTILISILVMPFTLIGCKIEFPEDILSEPTPTVVVQEVDKIENVSFEEKEDKKDTKEKKKKKDKKNKKNKKKDSAITVERNIKKVVTPTPMVGVKKNNNKKKSTPTPTKKPKAIKTPKPVQPEDVNINKGKQYTCTMSISCKTILSNMSLFNKDKMGVLPSDGIIFKERTVVFYEGETVFEILVRETKANGIHMEFVKSPGYNSSYIEGINNIYEFDCGESSGWMYGVNGWFPNYGCSMYQVKQDDKIEWLYTCDLGFDIGAKVAS